jgi:hypothetical protein
MDNRIYEIRTNPLNCCCVCFCDYNLIFNNQTNEYLSLNDIENIWFENEFIPDELLIKNPCDKHYLCIGCLRKITHNYENHLINENESHIYCPFPFEKCENNLGFRYIFDHSLIKKVCRNEKEWQNYMDYSLQYEFPGYTKIKCPSLYYFKGENIICNSDILIETEEFKSKAIGELIITCDQNINCLKRCCYNCKKQISFYTNICYTCATTHENENPNVLNYFLNKTDITLDIPSTSKNVDEFELESMSKYNPEDYLYYNKDITEEIALEQLKQVIDNYELYMICPICKISLYKTEKCNGLSHHNVERCYVCGRVGYKIKGLGDHWSPYGDNGCFRFESDSYIRYNLTSYICSDIICHNHDKGECNIPEHQEGIEDLDNLRKSSTILHIINSLLPNIRYNVYDKLHTHYINSKDKYHLIPYKQTLLLLEKFKSHSRDCTEKVIYDELKLKFPEFTDKSYTIDCTDYISQNQLIENNTNQDNENFTTSFPSLIPSINQIRIWRENFQNELEPLLRRRRQLLQSTIQNVSININQEEHSENTNEENVSQNEDYIPLPNLVDNEEEDISDTQTLELNQQTEEVQYNFVNISLSENEDVENELNNRITEYSRNLIQEIIREYSENRSELNENRSVLNNFNSFEPNENEDEEENN